MTAAGLSARPRSPAHATFKSSLDLVSVAVVVRDAAGRLVTGLRAEDFEIMDGGVIRAVSHFEAGQDADARIALLVDSSGSMIVGSKPERTRLAADFLISGLRPADMRDGFSFDSEIRRLTPYTSNPNADPRRRGPGSCRTGPRACSTPSWQPRAPCRTTPRAPAQSYC